MDAAQEEFENFLNSVSNEVDLTTLQNVLNRYDHLVDCFPIPLPNPTTTNDQYSFPLEANPQEYFSNQIFNEDSTETPSIPTSDNNPQTSNSEGSSPLQYNTANSSNPFTFETQTHSLNGDPLILEILQRIDWNPEEFVEKTCTKRERNLSREAQQEKRKMTEKQRRDIVNQLIDQLNDILPGKNKNENTKITVLQQSVQYMSRMQCLCIDLLKENKQLQQNSVTSSVPTTCETFSSECENKKRKNSDISMFSYYNSRPVVLGIFFLVMLFSPLNNDIVTKTGSPIDQKTTRVLSSDIYFFLPLFEDYPVIMRTISTLIFLLVAFVVSMLWQHGNFSERFRMDVAETELKYGNMLRLSGRHPSEYMGHFFKVLRLANYKLPTSSLQAILMIMYQFWRYIMHCLIFGAVVERYIGKLKGTNPRFVSLMVSSSFVCLEHGELNLAWIWLFIITVNVATVYGMREELANIKSLCCNRTLQHFQRFTFRRARESVVLNTA